jgi:hypothetical protein
MSHPKIKSFGWFGAILFALAIAVPVNAQFSLPQVPGFSDNYPWFNEVHSIRETKAFSIFSRTIRTSHGLSHEIPICSTTPIGVLSFRRCTIT